MKFYLASSFRLKTRVQEVYEMLKLWGHEVPDIWWNIDAKNSGPTDNRAWAVTPLARVICARHWASIQVSDALIIIADGESETRFTGANVECGFALGRGLPVFSVGQLERSAMYAQVIQAATVDELRELIEIFSGDAR